MIGGHLGVHHYPLLFHSEMMSIDFLTSKTYAKTPNLSLQDRSRWSYTVLGIRVRQPSWTPSWITPFCPTSGMATQVFFQSPMGPLQRSRVKIRGHMLARRTPLGPGLIIRRYRTKKMSKIYTTIRFCRFLQKWTTISTHLLADIWSITWGFILCKNPKLEHTTVQHSKIIRLYSSRATICGSKICTLCSDRKRTCSRQNTQFNCPTLDLRP